IRKAEAHARKEEADDSLHAFDRALRIAPDRVEAWAGKASVHESAKQYDRALRCLEKALSIDDGNAGLWDRKAQVLEPAWAPADALVHLGRLEAAAAAEDAFLAAQPRSYDGLELRRETMKALHRWSELAETCGAILEVQPRDAGVLKDLGLAHLSTGAFHESLAAYDAAITAGTNDLEAWRGKRDALDGL